MFFDAQKHASNRHVRAPNHHDKTTNSPSKITTFSRTPFKKACKNSEIRLHQPHKKIIKQNPPPIEKSCHRNES